MSPAYAPGRPVVSTSVTAGGGFAVLVGGGRAAAVVAPGQAWRSVPAPPAGTAVPASLATAGTLEALEPSGSDLVVDALGPSGWRRVQRLAVSIRYGSTSAGGGSSG